MKRASALLLLLLCSSAAAQVTNPQVSASGFTINWTRPTEADGGRIDCTQFGNGCVPLNVASCDEAGRPIEVELRPATTLITPQSKLFVWLTTGTCTFEANSQPAGAIFEVLELDDPLVNNTVLVFPDDVSGAQAAFGTTRAILDRLDACGEERIQDTTHRICFGISLASAGASDDAVTSTEPNGYIQFLVDTRPPPAPATVDIEPRDGALQLDVEITDSSIDDLDRWFVVYRVTPTGEASGEPCTEWTDAQTADFDHEGGDPETDISLKVANGSTYELCVFARDRAGNDGERSATVVGAPRDECDFIECYPGDAPTGHCGATGSPALAALAGLAAWLRRRRGGHA